jgi:hypothetical protein
LKDEDTKHEESCCAMASRKAHLWFQQFVHLNFIGILLKVIPILDWLPKYKWKEDFFNDLMSGFTVAVMHVPQGKNRPFLS